MALIAGSTTKGIRKRKAKTERIAVVPTKENEEILMTLSLKVNQATHPNKLMCTTSLSPNTQR
jgi:hypothetical protein